MKKIFILIVLIFSNSVFSQIKNFELIEKHVKNIPESETNDLNKLSNSLRRNAITKKEIVERIYVWMATNIDYDWDAFLNNKEIDVSAEITLKNKKSVCSGYANLFKAICDILRIKCVVVEGYAKGYGYNGEVLKEPNHAWNAVKLYDKWQLIDVTWGNAQFEIDGKLEKSLSTRYLFDDPNDFILEHYPVSDEWQLLNPKINIDAFFSTEMDEKRKIRSGEIIE